LLVVLDFVLQLHMQFVNGISDGHWILSVLASHNSGMSFWHNVWCFAVWIELILFTSWVL